MSVEIHKDLVNGEFWKSVKAELIARQAEVGLAGWKIVLTPSVRDCDGKFDPIAREAEIPVFGDRQCVPTFEADGALSPKSVAEEILTATLRKLKQSQSTICELESVLV